MGDVHSSMHAASAEAQIMPLPGVSSSVGQSKGQGDSKMIQVPNSPAQKCQTIQITKSENMTLPTPVSWKKLQRLLHGYDEIKADRLVEGFKKGFSIHFSGEIVSADQKTLLSAKRNPNIVDAKLAKELEKGRIAGPFDSEPFENFKTSPIGLVPEKIQGQFRLIHHLSYPKHSQISINAGIPQEFKSVSYATIGDAISYLRNFGCGSFMAKTDTESAFRIVPLAENQYPPVGFVWKEKFYYDRCMVMGAASSCKTFEEVNSALEWIARNKGKCNAVVHIIDDFLFLAPTRDEVALALKNFQEICSIIGIPLSVEKTFPPSTVMEFMGITLDADRMEARLPDDKLLKMRQILFEFRSKSSCTLKELLSLVGLLNFACSVIRPARALLRRNFSIGMAELHHFVKIDKEAQLDISVWLGFLTSFNGKSLFLFEEKVTSDSLQLYTDAAAFLGYGACFQTKCFLDAFQMNGAN